MARGFALAGAGCRTVHLSAACADPSVLAEADLIGFPGGFSYGDDVASGRVFAMRLREGLYPALRDAVRRGVLVIGACNGFQVLAQAGLLPGPADGRWPEDEAPAQEVALTFNAGGRFIDRWVGVRPVEGSVCVWTRGLDGYGEETMRLPIAHGEGRFVVADGSVMARLEGAGQVALRYAPGDNPNGSQGDVAGICDTTGRVFGLMPHPERYLDWNRHPFWTRLDHTVRGRPTPGLAMFRSAVAAVNTVAARG